MFVRMQGTVRRILIQPYETCLRHASHKAINRDIVIDSSFAEARHAKDICA